MTLPRVFVSHNHSDNGFCRAFVDGLRARGLDVWYDEHNLGYGALRTEIDRELAARECFIAILSPAALTSRWVNAEIDGALDLLGEGRLKVFLPVVAKKCDVPPTLRGYKRIEAPGGGAVNAAEAVGRVAALLGAPEAAPAPAVKPVAPKPPAPQPVILRPVPQASAKTSVPQGVAPKTTLSRRALIGGGVVGVAALTGAGWWLETHGLVAQTTSRQHIPTFTPTATQRPAFLPASLASLGFSGSVINGTQIIIPPVVSVPAGPFTMGSNKAVDPQANDDETPQSQITTGAYQIGTFDVTVAEYALAVQAKAVPQPPDSVITWQAQLALPDHPVVNVSWLNVVAYAAWVAQVTGDPWRLPTEAEWEKAARGTDGRIYPWGNQWDKSRANTLDGGPGMTTSVGAFANKGDTSPYGAHDMAGNVFQWCSSFYKSYPYNSDDGRENMSDITNIHSAAWWLMVHHP